MTPQQFDYLVIMLSENLTNAAKVSEDLKEKDYALAEIQQRLGQILNNQSKLYSELQQIKELVHRE